MKIFKAVFLSSLSIMVLTLIHHAYGAIIYEDPFRLHVVYFAVPVILILLWAYQVYQKNPASAFGKVAYWIFMVLTAGISIGMIGLYEGGYNHLLKNIFYFGGMSQVTLNQLFPPPTYEMPNDFWFEATGIFQFIFGIYGLNKVLEYWKRNKR